MLLWSKKGVCVGGGVQGRNMVSLQQKSRLELTAGCFVNLNAESQGKYFRAMAAEIFNLDEGSVFSKEQI